MCRTRKGGRNCLTKPGGWIFQEGKYTKFLKEGLYSRGTWCQIGQEGECSRVRISQIAQKGKNANNAKREIIPEGEHSRGRIFQSWQEGESSRGKLWQILGEGYYSRGKLWQIIWGWECSGGLYSQREKMQGGRVCQGGQCVSAVARATSKAIMVPPWWLLPAHYDLQ